MSNSGRPQPGEYLAYFDTYISLVDETEILPALESQLEALQTFTKSIPAEQLDVLHAPYTWTIKQVYGHCIDTERIFGYRAARFAAGDQTSLPGFDQDVYVEQTDYPSVSIDDLLEELLATRQSNLFLLRRQSKETWLRAGVADGKNMTVRAAAYVLVGHIRHHLRIVQQRLDNA